MKKPSGAEKLHTMIKAGKDLTNTVASHPTHTASVYRLVANIDFIFHGAITGGRQLQVLSQIGIAHV